MAKLLAIIALTIAMLVIGAILVFVVGKDVKQTNVADEELIAFFIEANIVSSAERMYLSKQELLSLGKERVAIRKAYVLKGLDTMKRIREHNEAFQQKIPYLKSIDNRFKPIVFVGVRSSRKLCLDILDSLQAEDCVRNIGFKRWLSHYCRRFSKNPDYDLVAQKAYESNLEQQIIDGEKEIEESKKRINSLQVHLNKLSAQQAFDSYRELFENETAEKTVRSIKVKYNVDQQSRCKYSNRKARGARAIREAKWDYVLRG